MIFRLSQGLATKSRQSYCLSTIPYGDWSGQMIDDALPKVEPLSAEYLLALDG